MQLIKVFIWLMIIAILLAGCAGKDAGDGRTNAGAVSQLREQLWAAGTVEQRNEVLDSLAALPGPDAPVADVLLEYLRERERNDAWSITDGLIKLMTDEQVAQLARELPVYGEANTTRYLINVLVCRIDTAPVLTDAVLSLQEITWQDWYAHTFSYTRFTELAWRNIFPQPGAAVNWLDQVYARLTDSVAKENLFYAVGSLVRGEITATDRSVAVGWLWQVHEQEDNLATGSRQLLELYKLGETRALTELKELYAHLAVPDRIGVIRRLGEAVRWHQPQDGAGEAVTRWLWGVAETDNSAFVRQLCLYILYELDEGRAMAQLVREIDGNGLAVFKDDSGSPLSNYLSWQFLKRVNDEYPQSYLARGIRAYEQVRGKPYFAITRMEQNPEVWPPFEHGDGQYDPGREIPGWEKFLADFSGHPAADDAAFRLARCYEIQGRWADALNTLQKAMSLPDGDLRYHVAGRMVYILDVRMTERQLAELASARLDLSLRPLMDYTLAVRQLRRNDYAQAAALLEQFITRYKATGGLDLVNRLPLDYLASPPEYDFWAAVERQLSTVRELADRQQRWEQSGQPTVLYDLAAAIYHNQLLYYNHLWLGGRQGYHWMGYIDATAYGRAPAERTAFAREMINYRHSLDYFQQVYHHPSAPPDLKAKALYSVGLSYIGLDQWGQDAWLAFSPSEVRGRIIVTYEQFVKEYPDSSMADDALLVLGAYTGEARYLERIIKDYPQGDMVEKARRLLEEMKSPYYGLRLSEVFVPYKVLHVGDIDRFSASGELPMDVRDWAVLNSRRTYSGTLTSGAWTYLLVATGPQPTAGYAVEISNLRDDGRNRLTVHYRVVAPRPGQMAAPFITHPYVLARIPRTDAVVIFEEFRLEQEQF